MKTLVILAALTNGHPAPQPNYTPVPNVRLANCYQDTRCYRRCYGWNGTNCHVECTTTSPRCY